MHKKLELFGKSTHTTMLNPNLSSENCGKKIQSDRPKKWSKITILSPITFWENSRSWSWSDLRSLFEQVILMWSKITKKVIGHYFAWIVLLSALFHLWIVVFFCYSATARTARRHNWKLPEVATYNGHLASDKLTSRGHKSSLKQPKPFGESSCQFHWGCGIGGVAIIADVWNSGK